MKRPVPLSPTPLIALVALAIAALDNRTLFGKVAATYPGQILFPASVFLVLATLLFILFRLVAHGRGTKPVLGAILVFSAAHAYFTDRFGIVGDETMILNIVRTNRAEASDLLSFELVFRILLFGAFPAALVSLVPLALPSRRAALLAKVRDVAISLTIVLVSLASLGKAYASFFREHKSIRYYANPAYFAYSSVAFFSSRFADSNATVTALGKDAVIPAQDADRELVVFVLGETARSDRFSLNGYARETNPALRRENVFSFGDVRSCGTSTAASVPCMFSVFGRAGYNRTTARSENLLDVLSHTGRVSVLWRDNNSDSKGVAARATYEDYKTPARNTICDVECRDEGMLVGLQEYVDRQPRGDVFIVLHQMGNHGPAYYKRYPEGFETFKPACRSNDLSACTGAEIGNAYDNAIRYTDYFLGKVIEFLKRNDERFETTLLYVSDHGESLGENGIYLHGLPYAISPIEQRKVPLVLWFGERTRRRIDVAALRARLGTRASHDNLFHTVLGLLEVKTAVYDPKKDLLAPPVSTETASAAQ